MEKLTNVHALMSDRELAHEVTLEEMKKDGSTPMHEDEVKYQEDLVSFELR